MFVRESIFRVLSTKIVLQQNRHKADNLRPFLVRAAWMQTEGFQFIRRGFPALSDWLASHPIKRAIERALDRTVTLATKG